MKKDLVVKFANSLGKNHDWTYRDLNPDLPIPAIKEACELLTTLDIFEQNGVKLFDSVVTAKIVDTYERDVFDVEKEPMIVENEPCEQEQAQEAVPFQAPENYGYLFEPSRNAIEQKLEGPAEVTNDHPSLIITAPQIGKAPHTEIENSASASSLPSAVQSETLESSSTQKNFFAWLRRRKNRNKDNPDIRSGDAPPPV
ncbi:hypothetical protein IGI39_004691 [Enterococcus sp. AZ135]|uniref:DUF2922 family protein n=1 Tax=unclassified Enterococcus TaxID=2608891 RepID=UPI003F23767E